MNISVFFFFYTILWPNHSPVYSRKSPDSAQIGVSHHHKSWVRSTVTNDVSIRSTADTLYTVDDFIEGNDFTKKVK